MAEFLTRAGNVVEVVFFCIGLGICLGIVIRVARYVGFKSFWE